jgi:molybdopterin converting factor small subunit
LIVNVQLVSLFAKYLEDYSDGEVDLDEGASVCGLAHKLGLPIKLVRVITVNGIQETRKTILSDGDVVCIFPPALGGG